MEPSFVTPPVPAQPRGVGALVGDSLRRPAADARCRCCPWCCSSPVWRCSPTRSAPTSTAATSRASSATPSATRAAAEVPHPDDRGRQRPDPAADPEDPRRRPGRRGHHPRRAARRRRSLPRHPAARRGRQRRHRRPPHDLRPAVQPPRRAAARATRSSSITPFKTYHYAVAPFDGHANPWITTPDRLRRGPERPGQSTAHADQLPPEGQRAAAHHPAPPVAAQTDRRDQAGQREGSPNVSSRLAPAPEPRRRTRVPGRCSRLAAPDAAGHAAGHRAGCVGRGSCTSNTPGDGASSARNTFTVGAVISSGQRRRHADRDRRRRRRQPDLQRQGLEPAAAAVSRQQTTITHRASPSSACPSGQERAAGTPRVRRRLGLPRLRDQRRPGDPEQLHAERQRCPRRLLHVVDRGNDADLTGYTCTTAPATSSTAASASTAATAASARYALYYPSNNPGTHELPAVPAPDRLRLRRLRQPGRVRQGLGQRHPREAPPPPPPPSPTPSPTRRPPPRAAAPPGLDDRRHHGWRHDRWRHDRWHTVAAPRRHDGRLDAPAAARPVRRRREADVQASRRSRPSTPIAASRRAFAIWFNAFSPEPRHPEAAAAAEPTSCRGQPRGAAADGHLQPARCPTSRRPTTVKTDQRDPPDDRCRQHGRTASSSPGALAVAMILLLARARTCAGSSPSARSNPQGSRDSD